jgi:hypothetical protein
MRTVAFWRVRAELLAFGGRRQDGGAALVRGSWRHAASSSIRRFTAIDAFAETDRSRLISRRACHWRKARCARRHAYSTAIGAAIHYAMKANPFAPLLGWMRSKGRRVRCRVGRGAEARTRRRCKGGQDQLCRPRQARPRTGICDCEWRDAQLRIRRRGGTGLCDRRATGRCAENRGAREPQF